MAHGCIRSFHRAFLAKLTGMGLVLLVAAGFLAGRVLAQVPIDLVYGDPPEGWTFDREELAGWGRWLFRKGIQEITGRSIYFEEAINLGAEIEIDPHSGEHPLSLADFEATKGVDSFRESYGEGYSVAGTAGETVFSGFPAYQSEVTVQQEVWQGEYGLAGGELTYERNTCVLVSAEFGECVLITEIVRAWTDFPATDDTAEAASLHQSIFEQVILESNSFVDSLEIVFYGGEDTSFEPYGEPGVEEAASGEEEPAGLPPETYEEEPAGPPPEPPSGAEDTAAILVLGVLGVLGLAGLGGALLVRTLLKPRKPASRLPARRVLVDARGRRQVYQRARDGRYINPKTGGVLDEAQWQEYNRHAVDNRRFSDEQAQELADRNTAFDQQMDQMVEQHKQNERDLHAVQQMEKSLLFNPDRSGLWRGPGEPGDLYTALKDLRQELSSGKPADRRRLDAARRIYRDHTQGKILGEDEIPSDRQAWRDTLASTLENSLREVITQQDSDGKFSWKAMGVRLLANFVTGGKIELVLTPLESAYTMHGYVQKGGDSILAGFVLTAGDVLTGEVMSYLGEKGAKRLAKFGLPDQPLPKGSPPVSSSYKSAAGVDIKTHMRGMPDANVRYAQQIAQKYNVKIMVRPTNPEARALLEKGLARPKPMMVKNKTINKLDTYLGAGAEDMGKVGHFKPKLPPKNSVPPELYEKVKNRYVQRFQEYRNQAEYIKKLQQQGKLVDRNGVLHEALPDGSPGKPFTGDHDLFEILDAHGRPCPDSLKQHVIKELQKPPFSAQHGAHMDWDMSHYSHTPGPGGSQSPYDVAQGIDQTIRNSHAPGGEPLIQFQPGTLQPVDGVFYTGV